jgi:4-azaleucine resistance transporter AzlC
MNKDFAQGLRDIFPMMVAYAPIGLLWGTIASGQGLTPFEALFMSVAVYSGTAQFVSMDLLASATPFLLLVLTIATVSLRHVLMSASVSRHLVAMPKLQASVLLFWLTDEAWALIERRALERPITAPYYLGVAFPLWPTWFVFCTLGAWLGNRLGDTRWFGLDFAFAAMFIALLAGFWKGAGTAMVLVASAVVAILAKLYLPGAWYIILGGIAGMLTAIISHKERADV